MFGMTVDHESRVFAIDHNGMPKSRSGFQISLSKDRPTLIMVNGFDFDPTEDGSDNPHRELFEKQWRPEIDKFIDHTWQVFGFGWYSAELEPSSWGGAILHGRWNPYRWGWDLAGRASGILASTIGWDEGLDRKRSKPALPEVCVIAHSLGTRVVLGALGQLQPRRVTRVLLLNGAEYSQTARQVAAYTNAEVLNVMVDADDVLHKLGSVFAPEAFVQSVVGRSGIQNAPKHWLDVQLDGEGATSDAAVATYPDLRGDNPDKIMDHWYSYLHGPNWKLFGDFLAGEKTLSTIRGILS